MQMKLYLNVYVFQVLGFGVFGGTNMSLLVCHVTLSPSFVLLLLIALPLNGH